jgi:hypothetical protein
VRPNQRIALLSVARETPVSPPGPHLLQPLVMHSPFGFHEDLANTTLVTTSFDRPARRLAACGSSPRSEERPQRSGHVGATRIRYFTAGRSCRWPTVALGVAAAQPMAPSRPAVRAQRYRGLPRSRIPATRKHLTLHDPPGAASGPADVLRSGVSERSPVILTWCGMPRGLRARSEAQE